MKKTQIAPSTRTGSHHWLMQKISSVALIPLVIWLLYSIVTVASDVDANLAVFFAYPLNAILAILLIGASLYHGSLGMTVIFEDYIENKAKRMFFTYLIHFLSIVTTVAVAVSIIRLHLIG